MEDTFDFIVRSDAKSAVFSLAIYDGHGGCKMARELLDQRGVLAPMHASADTLAACAAAEESFVRVGTSAFASLSTNCGTTASVVSFFEADGCLEAVCANVGDSEVGVIRGEGIEMISTVHKIENDHERERLETAQVPVFGGRVFGALNITRAIGDSMLWSIFDAELPPVGVIPNPSVQVARVNFGDVVIAASDGFWDAFVTSESRSELARFVKALISEKTPLSDIAQTLVEKACASSFDNVTVALVDLDSIL